MTRFARSPWAAALLALAIAPAAPSAPQAPLPDLKTFLASVRPHLASNSLAQLNYVYNEQVTDISHDSNGRVTDTRVRFFEVYPAPDDDLTYRRLLRVNGVPVPADDLADKDREQTNKVRGWLARAAREGESDRQERRREEADARRKEQAIVDEVMQMYVVHLLWREMIDGRPAIAVMFTPDENYRPRSNEAKILRRFQGRAWFDEEEHQLVRLEARAVENASIALGFVARLDKGSHASFERRRHADGAWLPVMSHFVGTGRVLIFKRIDVDRRSDFSNYRPYDSVPLPPYALPRK